MQNSKISDQFEKIYHIIIVRKYYKLNVCKICVKSLPFYSVLEDNYFSWLLNLSQVDVTHKSHELAQASLLWGTVVQVSDRAHGTLDFW